MNRWGVRRSLRRAVAQPGQVSDGWVYVCAVVVLGIILAVAKSLG